MNIKLINNSPLSILVTAIRTCWDSGDKSDSNYIEFPTGYNNPRIYVLGNLDKKLINAVIKKNHTSTLEHLWYNFSIEGISRLVLQELARHRMATLSVKSTRYTLKELMEEEDFLIEGGLERAKQYINLIDILQIDTAALMALENLRRLIISGLSYDEVKYCLPESYKVNLIWTINCRSLRNFLELRTSPSAHFEIQELAQKIFKSLPIDHKFLYEDQVYDPNKIKEKVA